MGSTARDRLSDELLELTVGIVAEWLPTFAPPVGGNGAAVPYADRLKVSLRVDPDETLSMVRRRVVDELKPVATGPDGYADGDPYDSIIWCWFYEPADEGGLDHRGRYLRAEDLIVVDVEGRAHWNVDADTMRYGDLIRAGERGLLRGDPRRPYVVFLYPQGDHTLQTVWEIFLTAWAIFGHLLTAREVIGLGQRGVSRLKRRLDGVEVLERCRGDWAGRGGGPADVVKTVQLQPWHPDDLRMLLGLESEGDAIAVLMLLGLSPMPDGTYRLEADEEARILGIASQKAARASLPFAQADDATAELSEEFRELLDRWPDEPGDWPGLTRLTVTISGPEPAMTAATGNSPLVAR